MASLWKCKFCVEDCTIGPKPLDNEHWKGHIMPRVSYLNMYVSCCRRTFTFQMTGRQKYAAAMTGTIQGPIYLHIALEWLSLCDSGVWGWVAGILCCSSACWNKVDCWILFHNWIDFECSSLKVRVTTEEFDNIQNSEYFRFLTDSKPPSYPNSVRYFLLF